MRRRIGSILVLAGAVAIFASGFFPPGHERTHYRDLALNARYAIDCLQPDSYQYIPKFLGLALACSLSAVYGVALAIVSALRPGRGSVILSFALEALFLATAAASFASLLAGELGDEHGDPRLRLAYGAATAVVGVFAVPQFLLFRRALKREGRGDALHLLPLAIALAGGAAAAATVDETVWHSVDYAIIAAGAATAMAGMALRRG